MSNFILDRFESSFASYEAFEVACHALETYCDRLVETETDKLKVSAASSDIIQFVMSVTSKLGPLLSSYIGNFIDQVGTSTQESWVAKR